MPVSSKVVSRPRSGRRGRGSAAAGVRGGGGGAGPPGRHSLEARQAVLEPTRKKGDFDSEAVDCPNVFLFRAAAHDVRRVRRGRLRTASR